MKIKFKAHQVTDRNVELSKEELNTLFEAMKEIFLERIEFGTFDEYSYYSPHIEKIIQLCKAHNVDVSYEKDRVNFFTEIVNNLDFPL